MPNPGGETSRGQFNGDTGKRLYDKKHKDIDKSTIDIRCYSGTVEVTLREAIWYSEVTVYNSSINGPNGHINEEIEVDSDWYDGNHRLVVIARADDTRADVTFSSQDL